MRRLQKIGIIILIFIMGIVLIYKPQNVYADSGKKTLVIPIPSNDIKDYEDSYTYFQYWILNDLLEEYVEDDEFLVNAEGDRVLRIIESQYYKNDDYFELYEGATIEDCIFDISEGLREEMIDMRGEDPYVDYDKVQLVLQEFDPVEYSNPLVLDLSGIEDTIYLSKIDVTYFNLLDYFDEYFQFQEFGLYKDLNGKVLLQRDYDADDDPFTIGDGVSSDDDIIYELQDGDIEFLSDEYGIDASGYEKIVIKFGNTEYDDSYCVFDFTRLNEDLSIKYNTVWKFLVEKGLVLSRQDVERVYDLDGHELMRLSSYARNLKKIEYLKDFTYEDTISLDILVTQNLIDKYGVKEDINSLIIKFANPDFIEGDNQKYDLSSETGARFRLNIPFDKFQESGVVYLDGEEVDPSNYEATEGSTIITFKKAFMNGLDLGDHTLRVSVLDGESTTTFNIVGESPKTGDNLFLYVGLLLMSIFGFGLFRKYAK